MTDLIDTTEMYLRTIYELEEEGVVPLRARIAQRIGHSGPTVSQTVARMERDGLVTVRDDRHLQLTEEGHTLAVRVMRKHRLAERLLVDVIGLGWSEAHEEACRWEHVMSESVERRLMTLLGEPTVSPYGNPIPGLAEISAAHGVEHASHDASLVALPEVADGVSGVLRRIGEPLQTDPRALEGLEAAGARPGARVSVGWQGGSIVLTGPTGSAVLTMAAASHVLVSVD